ncbi:MAG: PqqD family protein [Candidatus Caldatribacteriota bacterium]
MYLDIANILIDINPVYESELKPLFLPYLTTKTPNYIIKTSLVDQIEDIDEIPYMQDKNRYFYKQGDDSIFQVKHASGKIKYQITMSKDLKKQAILFVEALNKKPSEMIYILISMCFLEVATHEGFLCLHASALLLQDEAILFSAPSKTGKSTHVNHYLDTFKQAKVLNDDKPLIKDGYVYGSPFSGKNMKNINAFYKLKAILFIYQSKKTVIHKIDEEIALKHILKNMLRPSKAVIWDKMIQIIEQVFKTDIYEAGLTISKDSMFQTYYYIYKETKMKLKPGFTLKDIGSKTMVIPVDEQALSFNGILTINKTAKVLFNALCEDKTIDELVKILLDKYDVTEDQALKDVVLFVETLKEKDLLI